MKIVKIGIDDIYVPQALRAKEVDAAKVERLALDIAEKGLLDPILVRADKNRHVLVSGRHRLEAMKSLGETQIACNVVQPTKR
ncbi:ParB family chromosome partitioning protein [Dongia mobilis]|uniref:ParB family chromosome partitioning protein n=1 Tax=Dongia mobilis TaxID=578943 RepID=A0A4R6WSS7_9PROT|nr:ParB N-terminal domain-containing protein [Dongia mobilis]TDQ83068.1 ParB family chromosome partitioning protein [Dongia mobilis]